MRNPCGTTFHVACYTETQAIDEQNVAKDACCLAHGYSCNSHSHGSPVQPDAFAEFSKLLHSDFETWSSVFNAYSAANADVQRELDVAFFYGSKIGAALGMAAQIETEEIVATGSQLANGMHSCVPSDFIPFGNELPQLQVVVCMPQNRRGVF